MKGEKQLQARMTAMGKTEKIIRTVIIHGVREAKLLVPRKTANLGRTIRPGTITPRSGQLLAGGTRNVGYAGYVERGTRPHIIRAKNKKSLFFPSQAATSDRFGSGARLKFNLSGSLSAGSMRKYGNAAYVNAKSVRHPGTKAQPYLVPGLQKAVKEQGLKAVVSLWNSGA